MPPVEIRVQTRAAALSADLACAAYYFEADTFIALMNGTLAPNSHRYDWKGVRVQSSPEPWSCREERRYIGFMGFPPSSASARLRTIFLRIAGDDWIYRVQVRGGKTTVDATRLDEARSLYPVRLNGPEPDWKDPEWSARNRLRLDYYMGSVQWQSTRRVATTALSSDDDGNLSSISLEVRHGG